MIEDSALAITLSVAAIILAGYFAGSETVFLSASRIKIEVLFRRKVKGIQRVYSFIKRPETFLVTALVGTNLSHVIFSSLIGLLLRDSFADFIIVLISSSLLLIFSEIIPKAIGWEFANNLIIRTAQLLNFFKILFLPINLLLMSTSNFLVKRFRVPEDQRVGDILTRKDIMRLIHESQKQGIIDTEEHEIIKRIFDLRHTRVKEAMIPRTEIFAVDNTIAIPELLKKFQESGYSRIPVFQDHIDNIVGFVLAKDLFFQPEKLEEILETILYIPETKSAFELLQEFREKKINIAVVVDEYGGTAGLISLEDLIEELFGEIFDEFDIDSGEMFTYVDHSTIVIDALAEIDEVNQKFQIAIPEGDYTTLGGFIIEKLGYIPKKDVKIELDDCTITIEKSSRRRVISVNLILKNPMWS
jgi:CBS domain containing-hemolysin-like protein